MKKIIGISLVILSVMLILPLTALKSPEKKTAAVSAHAVISKAEKAVSKAFLIYDTAADTVTEISADDYIFGVVAAEMPALYETEALKAQAVAAYTFACVKKAENAGKSYDLTSDPAVDQSFITREKAKEKWGDKADEYSAKIENAVKSVKDYMITRGGTPILAVYHAISSGKTEDCKEVWGKDIPYLKPVSSEGDKLAPSYLSSAEFTAEELKQKLSEDIDFTGDPAAWFSAEQRTDSGTLKTLKVCGKEVTGAKIRAALNLRSANFSVNYNSGKFVFTVRGYGHGVGMSQYGACCMAKQGSNFKEILTHYYSGCKVEKV